MNAFLQKKDLHLSCEWNAAFIQLGNEKFCCTESLDRRSNLLTGILPARGCNVWKTFEGEMRKAYLRIQPRSPLSSPLSQGAVREWCGLNFCAALGGGHRVSHCAWCLSPKAVLFFFFFFSTGGVVCLERHSGAPQCVGTRLLPCVEEDGKPLVPWEGNPWIWSDNTDA